MEDEDLIKKRFKELSIKAYNRNIFTFTDFLSLADVDLLYRMDREIANVSYKLYGGKENCDRVIARFGDELILGYEEEFPISCICVKASASKFAQKLNHRDFLGAVLNLGIERSVIGDILVKSEINLKDGIMAYIFCLDKFAEYITNNLDKINHTSVKCNICKELSEEFETKLEEMELLVASERLDVIISSVYNISRSQSVSLIRERKVYINSRLCENVSYMLKSEDIITVRGRGKVIYIGVDRQTKKGKLRTIIKKFI